MRFGRLTRREALRHLALFGGMSLLAGCGRTGSPGPRAVSPPAEGSTRVAYGPERQQFGDLRLPDRPGPHRVVVVVHGGFWRDAFDLAHLNDFCAALTAEGWATWNVEYRRLGDGGGWPATFLDVAAAADHVRMLAGPHALDAGRVVAVGHSAGGHLALWLAGRKRVAAESPVHSADPLPLRGVVALAGVADLRDGWRRRLGGGVVRDLIGGPPEQYPERFDAASPSELLPLGVPQVLVHGTEDAAVPVEVSRRYHAAAKEKGDEVRLVELPGAGHFEVIDPKSGEWPKVVEAVSSLV